MSLGPEPSFGFGGAEAMSATFGSQVLLAGSAVFERVGEVPFKCMAIHRCCLSLSWHMLEEGIGGLEKQSNADR